MISFFGFDLMANKAPKRKYIYFSLAPNQKRANERDREREISDWWYHRWFRRFRNEKGKTNGNDAQREMRRHITSFRGTFLANTKVRSLELHYRHFVDKQTTFGIVMKWREREKKKPKLILNRDYSFSLICKCKDSHIFEIKLKKTFHCRRRHNEIVVSFVVNCISFVASISCQSTSTSQRPYESKLFISFVVICLGARSLQILVTINQLKFPRKFNAIYLQIEPKAKPAAYTSTRVSERVREREKG